MTVSFFGHRDANLSAKEQVQLFRIIARVIEEGADCFLFGAKGNFDSLVASAVRKVKAEHPEIRSVLVIPYLNTDYDKELYDESVFPPLERVPKRFAIVKRNEWMIERSDLIIVYVKHGWGGAAKALAFAEKKRKRILRFEG